MICFPLRVVAPDEATAAARIAEKIAAKGFIPTGEIKPFLADVQPFDEPWFEAYVMCREVAG